MGSWTSVDDLIATLRRRWATGRYLRDYASGLPWTPVELPVKAPTAAELLDRFEEAVRWATRFQRDSHMAGGARRFEVTHRIVRGRNLGANSLPARIRIESFQQLCALLETTGDARVLDAILERTRAAATELVPWVAAHPLRAVEHQGIWDDLLATVAWIAANDSECVYLRQIDVDGVDTKFVDRHRKLLDDLLTEMLPGDRIDSRYTAAEFARRFRFLAKPAYTRLRLLGVQSAFPATVSELTLRTEELASLELEARTVFVVENEISYLAFPAVPDSIAVFGSGFGLASLGDLPWLDVKEVVYWGDIDTHGFDILHRLRARLASVRSILMDHQTLLAHRRQWVVEPSPTDRPLGNLTATENALYHDLIEDRHGQAVRLEQERVRFSLVRQALEPWMP
jgi:hypothetical protein